MTSDLAKDSISTENQTITQKSNSLDADKYEIEIELCEAYVYAHSNVDNVWSYFFEYSVGDETGNAAIRSPPLV